MQPEEEEVPQEPAPTCNTDALMQSEEEEELQSLTVWER